MVEGPPAAPLNVKLKFVLEIYGATPPRAATAFCSRGERAGVKATEAGEIPLGDRPPSFRVSFGLSRFVGIMTVGLDLVTARRSTVLIISSRVSTPAEEIDTEYGSSGKRVRIASYWLRPVLSFEDMRR